MCSVEMPFLLTCPRALSLSGVPSAPDLDGDQRLYRKLYRTLERSIESVRLREVICGWGSLLFYYCFSINWRKWQGKMSQIMKGIGQVNIM